MDESPVEHSLTEPERHPDASRFGKGVIGCAGLVVAALILLLFIGYVSVWVEKPSLKIVGSIERWV